MAPSTLHTLPTTSPYTHHILLTKKFIGMSRRNLTGSYTAPAHLVEVEEEPQNNHIITKNDYNSQRFNRTLDMEVKSYKERMQENILRKEDQRVTQLVEKKKLELAETEPPRKKLRNGEDPYIGNKESTHNESGNNSEQEDKERDNDVLKGNETEKSMLPTTEKEDRNIVANVPVIGGIPLTDDFLDKIFPKGFVKAPVPEGYTQIMSEASQVDLYVMPDSRGMEAHLINDTLPEYEGITMRKEDVKHFSMLVSIKVEALTDADEKKRFQALDLIFRAKNGPPNIRKKAMRSLNSNAKRFGPAPLFGIILPLMLEPALDEADRHILTKLLGRLVYQLDEEIRPYTHKIISAVSPLLIDEDMTLRLESRDVISTTARSAGLANIVSSLRPDLDHSDEYVRNLTARVFAIVAMTLGLKKVLPFVKAVIRSKKSWQARHTGIRIVHHLCIQLGGGNGALILPYLPQMVDVLKPGLSDELIQVRTATANTLAQMADSVHPYGIEAFEPILEPSWAGLKHHRGRALAAFLRCVGSMVPLMDHDSSYVEYSNYYTRELMNVMTREFSSPDDEMRKSLLRVMARLPLSRAIFPNYRRQVISPFILSFWTRRVALDSVQLGRLVVEATGQLALRFNVPFVLEQLTPFAKDANENLRRMAADAIHKIVAANPKSVIEFETKFDAVLVDAVLYALQEQTEPHPVYLLAISTVCKALGLRLEPHVSVILSTVLYRLKNNEPSVRQQSADLVSGVALVLSECAHGDTSVMRKLILFLYELLGEAYPEVLGSIVGALYACIDTLDRNELLMLDNPSVNMLLPTLTPILKNRHEKVQEQCIRLVGLIAKRNAETINAKEWMRVCFDLLDMLKSQRKRIRIAANATFGHIANTIGPQDVLAMLLNNLRVQERQMRVCTAVAIGIVADTCSPFTVLPALMNEYRVPDKNVQNSVLKAMSFMFEYLDGSTTKDYLFAVTPLLEDALTDRDQVHRQTASTVVRHLALNCAGMAHDDYQQVFIHFLNLVLPNIYESSPHVIIRMIECLDALRIVVGPGIFLNYVWAGLFQAARKVRSPYWKIYNAAYVQNCDAIVPYYPRLDTLPHDQGQSYNVDELDVWL